MTTQWQPRFTPVRRNWLLTDGTVVAEPVLEQTPSGRKVRVAGTGKSAYSRDIEVLIVDTIREIAAARGTGIWMPLDGQQRLVDMRAGYVPAETKAALHVLNKTDKTAKTTLWWRFKHPTLPIEALLTVQAGLVHYWDTDQEVISHLSVPHTTIQESPNPTVSRVISSRFEALEQGMPGDQRAKLRDLLDNHPAPWTDLLARQTFTNEHAMVEALLKAVRTADGLACIQVPDLRDPDNPAWLDLFMDGTNLNGNIYSDITEYLESTSSVEEALRLYNELRATLRKIGVVMGEVNENDFQTALLTGDKEALTVSLNKPNEIGGEKDKDHSLTMHLPTGTFTVNCALQVAGRDEIAYEWEKSLTIAKLTGQDDMLLAYAREYAKSGDDKRARTILNERKRAAKK